MFYSFFFIYDTITFPVFAVMHSILNKFRSIGEFGGELSNFILFFKKQRRAFFGWKSQSDFDKFNATFTRYKYPWVNGILFSYRMKQNLPNEGWTGELRNMGFFFKCTRNNAKNSMMSDSTDKSTY